MQFRGQPLFDATGHLLRYLHVDPHLVNVRHLEQLRPGSAPGVDEGADVGLAGGHDAIEGARLSA